MDAASARRLFDANAARYDRINRVISFGLSSRWYHWAASASLPHPGARVLDAFSGTGAVGLRVAERGGDVTLADVSPEMLDVAVARARELGVRIRTAVQDLAADGDPPVGAPFDTAVVMWGLRYVDDPERVIRGLARTLASGGELVIVEFVEPARGVVPRLAGFYFFHVLPALARLLGGDRRLYSELLQSTRRMGPPERLLRMIEGAGLEAVEVRHMGLGLVLGVVARPSAGA